MIRPLSKFNLSLMIRTAPSTGAWVSSDLMYRYALWRIWDWRLSYLLIGALNPSTAGATENDPTIEKDIKFAKSHGFGGFIKVNAYAYRATDPKELKNIADPVGIQNAFAIKQACGLTDQRALICYGAGAGEQGKWLCEQFLAEGKLLHALHVTKDGHPGHPLYLKDETRMQPYTPL